MTVSPWKNKQTRYICIEGISPKANKHYPVPLVSWGWPWWRIRFWAVQRTRGLSRWERLPGTGLASPDPGRSILSRWHYTHSLYSPCSEACFHQLSGSGTPVQDTVYPL